MLGRIKVVADLTTSNGQLNRYFKLKVVCPTFTPLS